MKPNAGIVFAYQEQIETHKRTGKQRTKLRPLIEIHIGDEQVIYFSTMDIGGDTHEEIVSIMDAIEHIFKLAFTKGKLTVADGTPPKDPNAGMH